MSSTNEKIDRQVRQHALRRALPVIVAVLAFMVFMGYSLYMEYGPDAEVVDLFPELEDVDRNQ